MIEIPVSQQFQLGLLALQNQLVSQSTLVAALETWWADRSRPLGQILVEHGAISDASRLKLVKLLENTHAAANRHSTIRDDDQEPGEEHNERSATDRIVSGMDLSKATIQWGESDASQDQWLEQSQRARNADGDRFRIIRHHARGGLGVVFVAEDQQLHRPVALKQIREDHADSDWVRNKFFQEAEVTGKLEHPGIVPIYALGVDPMGKPYYAMRFIEGKDLGFQIQKFHSVYKSGNEAFNGPNLKHLLRRFLDVCDAIQFAHSRHILHRDLKPTNVMLGEFGETLVVDWGLAKILPSSAHAADNGDSSVAPPTSIPIGDVPAGGETMQGQFMGTVAYASPEQLLGQVDLLGPTSDIYSLGAILYELLTSHAPGKSSRMAPRDMAQVIKNDEIPKPRSLVSACPAPLESICRKAMASSIDQRYQQVADLRNDLEAWLDDEPCIAHPDTLSMKSMRWIRHHPVVVGMIATVIISATVATVVLLGIATNKNRQILAEKATAEAVTEVLVSSLQSTDPNRQGRKVTVAESLESSEARLVEDRAMAPTTKAHVASAIMDSYMSLNLPEEALRVAKLMNQICDENLPPASAESLLSRCQLAIAFWSNNMPKEAIELLEKNARSLEKVLGESNPDVLSVYGNLALMYMGSGQMSEAEHLNRRTLATYEKYDLLETDNAFTVIDNQAQILAGSGRRDEAVAMLRKATVRAERKLGPTHTVTLRLMNNLANYLTEPSEAKDAVQWSQKAYYGSIKRYGNDPQELLTARNTLIANLAFLKEWEKAILLLEESESDCNKLNDDVSVVAGQVRNLLINACLQTERYASVERLARKMLLPEYVEFPGLPPQTARVVLALALVRQDRASEAGAILADFERLPEFQKLTPASLAVFQGLRGEIALSSADYEQAIELLTGSWEKLSSGEPVEIYNHVPRYLAIALAKIYEAKKDEENRMRWLEKSKSPR